MKEQERLKVKYKTGNIKFIEAEKGFGFICGEESGKDVFFHISRTDRFKSLKKGDLVSYVLKESAKGFEGLAVIAIKTK